MSLLDDILSWATANLRDWQRDALRRLFTKQELPQQDACEGHIDRVAAESERARCDEFIRAFRIDPDPEALPKRDQAPEHQPQPRQAGCHTHPGAQAGLKEPLVAYGQPAKRRRES